jgi:hypothetical protein
MEGGKERNEKRRYETKVEGKLKYENRNEERRRE